MPVPTFTRAGGCSWRLLLTPALQQARWEAEPLPPGLAGSRQPATRQQLSVSSRILIQDSVGLWGTCKPSRAGLCASLAPHLRIAGPQLSYFVLEETVRLQRPMEFVDKYRQCILQGGNSDSFYILLDFKLTAVPQASLSVPP